MEVLYINNEKKKDLRELINSYISSRATEYSRFFTGLTGVILTALSIYSMENQRTRARIFTKRGKRLIFFLPICIALTVVASFSFTGLLRSTRGPSSLYIIERISSGEFETNKQDGISRKTFYLENVGNKTVTLSFFTENCSPIHGCDAFKISWDYDGSPILPGHGLYITFTLNNSSFNGASNVVFDIVVVGIKQLNTPPRL